MPRLVTGDAEAAGAFIEEALARGHEGVMAKALDATYEAGARGAGWLKIKRAHTLDLVVLAAEWGHGRRRGWLTNLHLGACDPATGGFVMLGKTFKGMTDQMLAWQTEKLQALATGERRPCRPRPAGAAGRGRLQRHPGEPALSRRLRAPLRPHQGLPHRQAAGGSRHDRNGAGALRAAVGCRGLRCPLLSLPQ